MTDIDTTVESVTIPAPKKKFAHPKKTGVTVAFKLQLRPTPAQESAFAANSIYSRNAYNWAVALSDFAWLVKRVCAEANMGKTYREATKEERAEFWTKNPDFLTYLRSLNRIALQKMTEDLCIAIQSQTEYVNKDDVTVIKKGERARHMKFLAYFREGLVRNNLIDGELLFVKEQEIELVNRIFDVMYAENNKAYPGFGGRTGSEAYIWVPWKLVEGNWDSKMIFANTYMPAMEDFKRGQGYMVGTDGKKVKTTKGTYMKANPKGRKATPSFGLPAGVNLVNSQDPRKNIVLSMPRVIGEVATNRSWKKLVDIINDGGSIGATRVYYDGAHWWAALAVTVPLDKSDQYVSRKRHKHAKDVIGVDRGARGHNLVTVSQPLPPIVTGDGRIIISQKNGNIGGYKMSKKTHDRLLTMKRALSRKQDAREQRYQSACTQARKDGAPRPRKDDPSGEEMALLKKIRRIETTELASKQGRMHQISSYLAKNSEVVGFETLNIGGMKAKPKPKPKLDDAGEPVIDANGNPVYERNGRAAKRALARVISVASMGGVSDMTTYKVAQTTGGSIEKIDRFFPSSKRCSQCAGEVNIDAGSSEVYDCGNGHVMNRDLNAAHNIEKETRRILATR
jgi:transposase